MFFAGGRGLKQEGLIHIGTIAEILQPWPTSPPPQTPAPRLAVPKPNRLQRALHIHLPLLGGRLGHLRASLREPLLRLLDSQLHGSKLLLEEALRASRNKGHLAGLGA